MFMLKFWFVYVLQTSSKSLRCKYGFSDYKPWNVGKSWIIPGLELNWEAYKGNTIQDGVSVLVGFMYLSKFLVDFDHVEIGCLPDQ